MGIVNSLNQVRAVKVEEFLRGRLRLRFRPFLEVPKFILELCHPFKGFETYLVLFISNSGKGSCLAIPFAS
jgi:hypothetical protein